MLLLPLALHFCLWRREQNNPPITKTLYTDKRDKKTQDLRYNLTNDNITIMNGPELGRRWVSSFNQQKLMFLLQSSNTE